MATIVRPHPYSDDAAARPNHSNKNEDTLYNEINGNLDWENLKAALQNAANGFVKLDASAKVPTEQLPAAVDPEFLVPSGAIIMWSGTLATIPAGWSLCDGSGSTPDLRGKFIYGTLAGVDPGDVGGAVTHTHTYSDLPQHNHTLTPNPHHHTYNKRYDYGETAVPPQQSPYAWRSESTVNTGNTTLTIANAGVASPETDAGSTLPPYFKLAFIMKDQENEALR